jgi:hypothetical protein
MFLVKIPVFPGKSFQTPTFSICVSLGLLHTFPLSQPQMRSFFSEQRILFLWLVFLSVIEGIEGTGRLNGVYGKGRVFEFEKNFQ